MCRFLSTDRFAATFLNKSPFNYAANNPVRLIDVNGDSAATSVLATLGHVVSQLVSSFLSPTNKGASADEESGSLLGTKEMAQGAIAESIQKGNARVANEVDKTDVGLLFAAEAKTAGDGSGPSASADVTVVVTARGANSMSVGGRITAGGDNVAASKASLANVRASYDPAQNSTTITGGGIIGGVANLQTGSGGLNLQYAVGVPGYSVGFSASNSGKWTTYAITGTFNFVKVGPVLRRKDE
jgi:hypothetical protein